MSFRVRIGLVLATLSLVPLLLYGIQVRRTMRDRLTEQAGERVESVAAVVRRELDRRTELTRQQLRALGASLEQDTRFRLAAMGDPEQRRWLLDWAGQAMQVTGLDVLEILDDNDRVVSSGHFRNDFDRPEGVLATVVRADSSHRALAVIRLAEGSTTALVALRGFEVGGRRFSLLGGARLDSASIRSFERVPELRLSLTPTNLLPSAATRLLTLPLVDQLTGAPPSPVSIAAEADVGFADLMIRTVDRWLLLSLAGVMLASALAAWWLGGVLARPVVELTEQAAGLDLDRLDRHFAANRNDELGTLARVLDEMTRRLRSGAQRLRETERRATVGDLARQVNHDIKNGLTPIRHVVRHLTQTAEQAPNDLPGVYAERRGTLEASVEYLDQLARTYAKLAPGSAVAVTDLQGIVLTVAGALARDGVAIETELGLGPCPVRADGVVLRRIVENLALNALEAVPVGRGRVRLAAGVVGGRAMLTVLDNGPGIASEAQARIFEDFFTTKPEGTGLGLTVVRRLVTDLGGTLKLRSALGKGTEFTVEMPLA